MRAIWVIVSSSDQTAKFWHKPAEEETILYADIDPSLSDQKRRVFLAGEYELDIFNDRRPKLYGEIVR